MVEQRKDTITQLTIPSVVGALRDELPDMTGGGICLLAAHIHLETGLRACHCWNVGNAKSSGHDGRDWCMFACGEEVPSEKAEAMRQESPALVEFRGSAYSRNGHSYQSIWLKPPHPWTRFRAFNSLREGVADHIKLLRTDHYRAAWDALADGLPGPYSDALARAGYFTAGPAGYARTLRTRLLMVRGALLGRPTLRYPSNAHESVVRECQRLIGAPETGTYDLETVSLVRAWQEARGLGRDGVFGDQSWATALPGVEVLP